MLYEYDKSLISKIKKVFDPDRVVYAPVDKFYDRYLMHNKNKSIDLPAISIWRTNMEFDPFTPFTQSRVANFRMDTTDELVARQIYSMKVQLTYNLDIWASTDVDRDDLLKELLFFFIRYPNISITYQDQNFAFPVHVDPPEDTTDISNFENNGDLYRITMPLLIKDARFLFYDDVDKMKYVNLQFYTNNDLDSNKLVGE